MLIDHVPAQMDYVPAAAIASASSSSTIASSIVDYVAETPGTRTKADQSINMDDKIWVVKENAPDATPNTANRKDNRRADADMQVPSPFDGFVLTCIGLGCAEIFLTVGALLWISTLSKRQKKTVGRIFHNLTRNRNEKNLVENNPKRIAHDLHRMRQLPRKQKFDILKQVHGSKLDSVIEACSNRMTDGNDIIHGRNFLPAYSKPLQPQFKSSGFKHLLEGNYLNKAVDQLLGEEKACKIGRTMLKRMRDSKLWARTRRELPRTFKAKGARKALELAPERPPVYRGASDSQLAA